jgi:hypothetical protein
VWALHGIVERSEIGGAMTEPNDYVQQLRRDWVRVGKIERGKIAKCGVCACKSNEWETVGSTMLGIKTKLICPGKLAAPALHEKIANMQSLLRDDALPVSVQQDIVAELKEMRALIEKAGQTEQHEKKE